MKSNAAIRWGDYHGVRCITLESDALKVSYSSLGGRMVSLVDKRTKREYLVQQSKRRHEAGTYDERYEDYSAGFDDMFPTIDECFYPSFPWQGHRIPDHGEVWSLEWQCEVMNDYLHMEVDGVRLPYKLSKDVRMVANNEVRIDYRAENFTDFDLEFVWTAHPMALVEEEARILAPPECTKAVCVVSEKGRIGSYGTLISWPKYKGKSGKSMRLDILGSEQSRDTEKYFFTGRLRRGWGGIHFPSDESTFLLTFPVDKVPYLGICVNKGGWSNLNNIIMEPCTAPFDRLDISRLHTRTSVIRSRGAYEWNLGVRSLVAGETWEK